MLNPGWQKHYYKYLTEKVDKGAKNLVVDITTQTIIDRLEKYPGNIKIADLGCFTGSIINRVYINLPDKFKRRISLFGLDNDKEVLELAVKQRPHIEFIEFDLSKSITDIGTFDIIIVSNVLHELYSKELPNKIKARQYVLRSLTKIKKILSPGGHLILLDGILPEKPHKIVKIEFLDQEFLKDFSSFVKSSYILQIEYKILSDYVIQTNTQNLAAFLTKSRYLKEEYWNNEAKQTYQYFTLDQLSHALKKRNFKVEEIVLQNIPNIENKIKILDLGIKIPPKNVLIKVKRIN